MNRTKEKTLNGEKLILRRKYVKSGYRRKSYIRRDGVKVRATKVGPVHVRASWIKKQGLTSGKRGLIPLKDDRHLKKFGYAFSKSSTVRHDALKKAVKKYGKNWAIRRINAVRNIHPKTPKYANLRRKAISDISFIQKHYAERETKKRSRR